MGLSDYKINSFSKPVSALDDTPQMSASELKEWFDSNTANELKQSVNGIIEELKDVDVSKQHTHDNKDVLDKITEEPIYNAPEDGKLYARKDGAWNEFGDIPSISSDELDTFTDGVCRVKGDKYFDGESFFDSIYTIESENYALCIAHCEYEGDSWDYYQTLIFGSGQMYTRYKNDRYVWDENDENYGNLVYGEWGEWKPVKLHEAYSADYAVKAHKDYKGNIIADTYATKAEGIPSIVYTEIDNFLDGVCKVTPKSAGEPLAWDGEKFSEEYSDECITSEMYALCLAYKYENDGFYASHTYYQMLVFPDGNIHTRHRTSDYDPGTDSWSEPEWSNWTPFMAKKARNDENNRRIVDTYATKEELTDKHTWKLLGEATVTEANVTDAGEDGVTSIAIDCGYLGGYDELRINLQCGVNDANASLPSAQRFNVGILNDVSEVCGQDDKLLIFNQGSTNAALNPTYTNNLIINSYFTDGILQYSEIFNTNFNSHNYKITPVVALPSLTYKLVGTAGHAKLGHPIDLKNGNHIVVFQAVSGGFKFPAGTELKVYGR